MQSTRGPDLGDLPVNDGLQKKSLATESGSDANKVDPDFHHPHLRLALLPSSRGPPWPCGRTHSTEVFRV